MAHNRRLIGASLGAVFILWAWHCPAVDASPSAAANPAQPATAGGSLLELPGIAPTALPPASPSPVVPPAIVLPAASAPAPAAAPPMLQATPAPATPAASAVPQAPMPPAPSSSQAFTPAPMTPSAVSAPATAPQPAPSTDSLAQQRRQQDVATKNPDLLLEPTHTGNLSLMFNAGDMTVILQALDVYDNTSRSQKADTGSPKDDLNSLIDSLKPHGETATAEAPPTLPNLYLGSIVYYTPAHWSVWINGRKLANNRNQPSAEFYVDRLSASEMELVWKPVSLLDLPALWRQLTNGGSHPRPNVTLNEAKGTLTLRMHPNQTFVPKSLAIREGLIKSSAYVPAAAMTDVSAPPPSPPPPPTPPSTPTTTSRMPKNFR